MKRVRSGPARDKTAPVAQAPLTAWYASYWIVAAVALMLACQAYSAAMRGPFLFDDLTLPFASPIYSQEPLASWISGVRPVLMLSYWMNYQSSAASTFAYHLTSVALHALNALLVFGICNRLFRLRVSDPRRVFVASAFSCSLFLLHPLQTESVAYVAGRSEVLSATFVLSAWLIYVRRIGSPVTGLQSFVILLLFALASATKEQAVATVPAILLLTDWTFREGSMWSELRASKRLYVPLGIGAIIATAWVSAIIFASRSAGASTGISPLQYFFTECRAIVLYLRLFLLPSGQNADREFAISRSLNDHGAVFALFAIIIGVVVIARQAPLVRYGGFLFLAFLAPTSSVVPLADAFVERRMYLPVAGLAIAISAVLARLPFPLRRIVLASSLCSVMLLLLTYQRAQVWSNAVTFWQDVVAKSPGKARGYQHLTQSYVTAQRCDEAISHLERATHVMPRDFLTLVNWAQAYTCVKQPDSALQKLREAEKLLPSADVYGLMGNILVEQGKTAEAALAYKKAFAKEPRGTDMSHVYLGNLALLANDHGRAEEQYLRALDINPYSPEAAAWLRRLYGAEEAGRSRSTRPAPR